MSFKPMFKFADGSTAGNNQRFATEIEAKSSAYVRFLNWTMPIEWFVETSNDAVNYKHVEGIDSHV